MTKLLYRAQGALLVVMLTATAALAQMLTDDQGKTLYIFDKDTEGVPTCYDDCATKWPPYLGQAGAELREGWTLVKRSDDTQQWAYQGKPLYYYYEDMAAGDAKGDGVGGVWHTIAP